MRSLKFLQAIAIPRFARNDKFRDLRSRRASPRRDTPLRQCLVLRQKLASTPLPDGLTPLVSLHFQPVTSKTTRHHFGRCRANIIAIVVGYPGDC